MRAGWSRAAAAVLPLVAFACAAPAAAQPASDPPYIPTPMRLVDAMLALGSLRPGDVVYDLGSGDGRIVITAAQRGASGVGIEYDRALVDRSWEVADSAGVTARVDFRSEDLFQTDLSDASLLTLYLSAEFNRRLRPRILEQMAPGSRVVSHGFHMQEWAPDSTVTIGSGAERATLFLWIIPANADGFWYLDIERAAGLTLELHQRFQEVQGTVRRGDREIEIHEGSVRGHEISFVMVDRSADRTVRLEFRGKLSDDSIAGTVEGPPEWGTRRWSAVRFSAPPMQPR